MAFLRFPITFLDCLTSEVTGIAPTRSGILSKFQRTKTRLFTKWGQRMRAHTTPVAVTPIAISPS